MVSRAIEVSTDIESLTSWEIVSLDLWLQEEPHSSPNGPECWVFHGNNTHCYYKYINRLANALTSWSSPVLHHPWQLSLQQEDFWPKALVDINHGAPWAPETQAAQVTPGDIRSLTLKMSLYYSFLEPEIRGKLLFQSYSSSEEPFTSHPSRAHFLLLSKTSQPVLHLCWATCKRITVFKNNHQNIVSARIYRKQFCHLRTQERLLLEFV